jgi:hypothetical protein
MRAVAVACAVAVAVWAAGARADDDFDGGTIVFARGSALWRVDARGRGETVLVALPAGMAGSDVRALRSDAGGTVLLADLAGSWSWMRLDATGSGGSAGPSGSAALRALPCAAGPAQLADDGTAVVCADPADATKAVLYSFAKDKARSLGVPVAGARPVVGPSWRALVWTDGSGVWTAAIDSPGKRTQVAHDAPLRAFLAAPDGVRAVGVYSDDVYVDVRHTKQAEVLTTFQLDGTAARRQLLPRDAVVVDWTHDGQWVLVEDGGQACELRGTGGEYKCFGGYTIESAAPDGRWLVMEGPAKGAKRKAVWRGKLEGLYKEAPVMVVGAVDGAAVWVPAHGP